MRWTYALLALLAAFLPRAAAAELANPYDQPWRQASSVIVVDASELSELNFSAIAADPRIVGVIHRATMGNLVDDAYAARGAEARQRGLLWGAYHLGVEGDPAGQADLFLRTVGDARNVLLALDLEDVEDPRRMSADEALVFIERVRQRTGRTPIVYGNSRVVAALAQNPRFQSGPSQPALWYARYREDIYPEDLGPWRSYLLWQFSSEINCYPGNGGCPYDVPGATYDLDFNVFPGGKAELAQLWTTNFATAPFSYVPSPQPIASGGDEDAVTADAQARELARLTSLATPAPDFAAEARVQAEAQRRELAKLRAQRYARR